jgi:uncharacterized iron-regulated membrane protein
MTAATYSDGSSSRPIVGPAIHDPADRASRRWRSLWRIHFYAGMFAMPFIVFMALTGLVILYAQPIQDLTQRDVRTVTDRGSWVSFADQEQAVEDAFPRDPVTSMTMPADGHHATVFAIDDGSKAGRQVFVDPYSGDVLGSAGSSGGVVGLANRLHGFANNDSVAVPLPTVSAIWDGDAVWRDYVVGDLVLEVLGVWTLVLVFSGLYLWWPRRSRSRTGSPLRRAFGLRLATKGRARWRDLHGLSGVLLLAVMLLTLVSGMAWSTYWGPNFTALANEISPNQWTDAPASSVGTTGDLDRLGNKIPWNTGDIPVPASYATKPDGSLPAPISLDDVVTIAAREDMKPGYTVNFPTNSEDEAGNPVYGSFAVSNSWPRATGEARDLFLDQFSGATLVEQDVYGYGSVSRGVDTLVSTHMGTQLGIFSRILMTALCVLALWSVVSAAVMYWKRRRSGTFGLPRRPVDVRLAKRLGLFAGILAIAFPEWGITALAVLAFDRYVIRRFRPLRVAFGQR